ncbi:MAG TPA: PPC domain-containing DNA-binding protein [Nitrolancea sp.]|nr:PPC domain-containing DNA-binding protein [Nitrolancea sp.]
MKSMLLNAGERTYAVVFEIGDEFIAGLTGFAKEHNLAASHFTAIGSFSGARLGYFQIDRKEFKPIPVNEQVEVLTLIGNITLDQGEPKIHAHVVVGRSDGTTLGGHILEAHVRPTLEVFVVETPNHLQRTYNPDIGLALISL